LRRRASDGSSEPITISRSDAAPKHVFLEISTRRQALPEDSLARCYKSMGTRLEKIEASFLVWNGQGSL
jgi:hypothetical protein